VVNLDYNSCRGVGKHSTFLTHEGWVEAGSLTIGDQILSLDGTFGDVESISISNDPQVMYNLTVDISHTFAVGEGQWVVHNATCVTYGSTQESQLTQTVRLENKKLNKPQGSNLAVFTFREGTDLSVLIQSLSDAPADSRLVTQIQGNSLITTNWGKGFDHAEVVADFLINSVGISRRDVISIYSEYSLCPSCSSLIVPNYPQAQLTYSFVYPVEFDARNASVKTLLKRGFVGPIP
jgi:hypothetical protein